MLKACQVNIVPSNLQVTRCLIAAFFLLTPPQRLPRGGGAKRCENIDPATTPVISAKHTGWSTPVLMPVLVTGATGAALAEAR